MGTNPITGHSLRFKFIDGPVAGKSFDHNFSRNGLVTFREVGAAADAKPGQADQYLVASLNPDIHAVSYLSPASGHTLTTILDFKTLKLVAFASNEQFVAMQQGTFELLGSAAR
jgi:hypothetical protein